MYVPKLKYGDLFDNILAIYTKNSNLAIASCIELFLLHETNEKEVGEVGPEMQQKERDIKQDRDWDLRKLKNIFCCLSRKKEKSNQ